MPLTLYDDNGNYVWDTDNAKGGVIADIRRFGLNEGGTFTYPAFAGRTAVAISLTGFNGNLDLVTVDHDLGYPRMTVTANPSNRRVALLVR